MWPASSCRVLRHFGLFPASLPSLLFNFQTARWSKSARLSSAPSLKLAWAAVAGQTLALLPAAGCHMTQHRLACLTWCNAPKTQDTDLGARLSSTPSPKASMGRRSRSNMACCQLQAAGVILG